MADRQDSGPEVIRGGAQPQKAPPPPAAASALPEPPAKQGSSDSED